MPRTNASAKIRTNLTASELPLQALLRLEHAGRWVVWSGDFTRIIAAGDSHESVREAARRAGEPDAISEWVPPVPARPIDRDA